jgi:phage tail P2-like protein
MEERKMPDFKDVSMADLLPSSLKNDERTVAVAEAANEQIQCIDVQRELLHILANMDWSEEDIVELLAWQWHVDFWDDSLSLAAKRTLVKNSIPWHRRKGTPAVVEEMARLILGSAKIAEWFEYGGKPCFFRIECTDLIQDTATFDRVTELVSAVKNVRSWLEDILVYRERKMYLYFGGAQRIAKTMTIYPEGTVL